MWLSPDEMWTRRHCASTRFIHTLTIKYFWIPIQMIAYSIATTTPVVMAIYWKLVINYSPAGSWVPKGKPLRYNATVRHNIITAKNKRNDQLQSITGEMHRETDGCIKCIDRWTSGRNAVLWLLSLEQQPHITTTCSNKLQPYEGGPGLTCGQHDT